MKSLIFSFLFFSFAFSISAQDVYHQSLRDLLANNHNVTSGEWIFADNEEEILSSAIRYGGVFQNLDNTDPAQDFSTVVNAMIPTLGENVWDAGWKVGNNLAIAKEDVVLVVFYLRSMDGPGEVSFFVENDTTFVKEIFLNFEIDEEWRPFFIPFKSVDDHTANTSSFGFHMGNAAQTVELGGFTALNFENSVEIRDLPAQINNEFYGGFEEDAAWRADASQRIEEFRKADLSISVKSTNGEAINDAVVQVNMLRHQFDFGTAVFASRLAGNPNHSLTYEDKLTNLDGNGHGFNAVVFENDLKWDGWEEEWFVNKTQLQNAVSFLVEKDLEVRGHTLVWPGTPFLPEDIPLNYDDVDYMKERVFGHIESIMHYPGIGEHINEWDVLNEVVINQDVANAFSDSPDYQTGREFYPEVFAKARAEKPDAELWLNDYVTMTLNNTRGNANYELLRDFTEEIVNSDADIRGLGFQAHIGGAPNSIYDVLETLDDFHDSFGLKSKITEFDLPSFINVDLAGDYLRDFMTAVYSHESTEGFLFWSFWDGQTYMNTGANLYRADWSETPSHAAFVDLLFNQWWTEESTETNLDGLASVRGFKGQYEISYNCEGETIRDTIELKEAMEYEIVCDNITLNTADAIHDLGVDVFPNPSDGVFTIQRESSELVDISVLDTSGKTLYIKTSERQRINLDIDLSPGIYFLNFTSEHGKEVQKMVIF